MAMRVKKSYPDPKKTWLVPNTHLQVRPTGPLRKAVLYTFMGGIVATQAVTSLGSRAQSSLKKLTRR